MQYLDFGSFEALRPAIPFVLLSLVLGGMLVLYCALNLRYSSPSQRGQAETLFGASLMLAVVLVMTPLVFANWTVVPQRLGIIEGRYGIEMSIEQYPELSYPDDKPVKAEKYGTVVLDDGREVTLVWTGSELQLQSDGKELPVVS